MADEHGDDIGELRGQVRGLQSGFLDLGRKLDEGLGRLTEYIRSTSEKTDQRIDAQALRTDAKFEALAQAQLAQASGKGVNTWPIVGLVVTGLLGASGVGFSFWSLAKAPVDDKFATLAAAITSNAVDLKEFIKESREANKAFVPKEQIEIMEKSIGVLSDRQFKLAVSAAKTEQKVEDDAKLIAFLREDQQNLSKSVVNKDALGQINDRLRLNSERTQNLYDKNYATPRQPCLDSGAGCGPVALPGPSAQPSAAGSK